MEMAEGGHERPADAWSDSEHKTQQAPQTHAPRTDDSHSGDCPYGSAISVVCGSAATAPALVAAGPPLPMSVPFSLRPHPVSRVAGHIGEPPFRPPRG